MENSLSQRDAKVIWHPYTQHQKSEPAIPIVRGEGAMLIDENGRQYIDAVSSWWVNLHGHGNAYIADRIYKQALALEQVIFTRFTHEPAVTLAERLLSILPGNLSKIFYSDNGSTAVEVALKMAIQFWQNKGKPSKNKILAFHHAYHGDTFGAMSVSSRSLFTDAFKEMLFEVVFIETPTNDNLDLIQSIVRNQSGQIAAFIYEPLLQAAGGMRIYEAGPMNKLLEFIHSEDIICIADEILTGFGRTGSMFASDTIPSPADIICLSKGLTGGTLALGVTACTQAIFNAFLSTDQTRTFFHGHSFTANPLACSASLASLDLLQEKSCQEQLSFINKQHRAFADHELSLTFPNYFINIRVIGTILAFEINNGQNVYTNEIGPVIMRFALERGIYLRPLGNTVYVMPPYCISPQQLRQVYEFLLSIPDRLKSGI